MENHFVSIENRKKIKNMANAVKIGKMSYQKFCDRYGSMRNHMTHGNCIKLCHSLDLYADELMKGIL